MTNPKVSSKDIKDERPRPETIIIKHGAFALDKVKEVKTTRLKV